MLGGGDELPNLSAKRSLCNEKLHIKIPKVVRTIQIDVSAKGSLWNKYCAIKLCNKNMQRNSKGSFTY